MPLLELCKFRVTVLSTASAAAGYILAAPSLTWRVVSLTLGVLLLACGACALNQYQERDTDALMARTRKRPIPSGRLAPSRALIFSAILLLAGFIVLAAEENVAPVALGALAVLWYNGLYTPLKRKSAFAVVPGALIGALPPAMGWTAAGGSLFDPRLLAFALFLFMWQIPHFWFLLMNHREEYERAGLPVLSDVLSERQIARLASHWTLAVAVSGLSFPLYGFLTSPVLFLPLVAATLWFAAQGLLLRRAHSRPYCALFKRTGGYLLFILLLLSLDRLALFSF